MKKLFTLLILCSTFAFGQHIKKATFVLTDGKILEVEDVVYGDKVYEYKIKKKSNLAITKESVSEIIFDSIDFTKQVEQKTYFEVRNMYYENDLPEGVYETIEDFYKKSPSSTEKLVGKEEGGKFYENSNDLMAFNYSKSGDIIKNAFAIVYKGILFFGIKPSNKHESKRMKGAFAITYSKNYYIKVKYATPEYFYTEISSIPAGKAIGIMGSANYYGTSYSLMNSKYPFILVNKEQKFYTVKNCKRFNEYFKDNLNKKISCGKDDNFLSDVRELMIDN
ncbi:hypothetical protein [Empedobacter brevis]|uniref:hypothetical protein n=1 Tax=Empedobacter brevis TaxID=247 RepID=UPI002FE2794F